MLRHQIPTHLDVQDTMLLGLTARQSMHLMAGLAAALAVWHQLASATAAPVAVRATAVGLCLLATALLVLVRPHRRGLDDWAVVLLCYAAVPRTCVWSSEGLPAFAAAGEPDEGRTWGAFECAGAPASRGVESLASDGALPEVRP
jgi:hypothetical protein